MTADSGREPLEQALARLGDEFDAMETPRYDRWVSEELHARRTAPDQVRQQAESRASAGGTGVP